jgi:CRP-like cAMP-binding protein
MSVPTTTSPDQTALLTTSILKLAPELWINRVRAQRVAIKYKPARTHLMITPEQWTVLQYFHEGRRAPDVLCELIANRQSLPLAEYYELMLKSVRTGILHTDGYPVPPVNSPAPWHQRFHPTPVLFLSLMSFGFGSAFMVLRPLTLPTHAWELLLGWVVVCIVTSLGYAAAASTLRGADGEVYLPRWNKRTLTPHFVADLDDIMMLPRADEINVALVRLAPHFVAAFAASLYLPGILFPVLLGLMAQLAPVRHSPLMALLRALYREPPLDTAQNVVFIQKQSLAVLLLARLKFTDKRFLVTCAGYTVVWLLLLFLAGSALLQANAWDLLQRFRENGSLHVTAIILLIIMGAMVAGALGLGLWIAIQPLIQWTRKRHSDRIPRDTTLPPTDPDNILKLLAEHILFRELAPPELARLAARLRPESHQPGSIIVRQGEKGEKLYLIYGGTVEVLREPAVGLPESVAELTPGDIFGEISLLRGVVRTRTVRCSSPAILLTLSKQDFDGLILPRISRDAIETAVQKVAFLKRIPLSSKWSPAAIAAFAGRATFRDFHVGEKLVVHGDTNQFFHVVYEGELGVEKSGREIARLKTGDFFGEISLLQSSTATAAVIGRTQGRCLLLVKRDFLEFVSRDFLIGLQFEEISSSRMGRPIFPLAHAVFVTDQR